MLSFKEAGLPQPLFHRLEQMGIITPTPIQTQAIPPAMLGRDILGSAQTGTGKTAAFGIPLVTKLLTEPRGSALILLPTRELATQVLDTLKKFIGSSRISTALLIGGESMGKQFTQLKARPRLIVGTPGRINDHLERGTLMLHDVNFLVLDETDRMLDMGFGAQLDRIARFLTNKRQTLMFSATLPHNIQSLSAKYLTDPIRISVGSTVAPAANVTQEHVHMSDSEKYPYLLKQLDERTGSIIIFVRTKHGADRMAVKLCKLGHQAEALHGDLKQSKRDRVIAQFRLKQYRILVATDVAARGLDIPHIEHVINYDLPHSPEDYIHRIGRTARAGAEGAALNLLGPSDRDKWRAIQKLVSPAGKEEFLPRQPRSEQARGERSERSEQPRREYAGSRERNHSKRNAGRNHGERSASDRNTGGRNHSERNANDRTERNTGERNSADRNSGGNHNDRNAGERNHGDRNANRNNGGSNGGNHGGNHGGKAGERQADGKNRNHSRRRFGGGGGGGGKSGPRQARPAA